MSDSYWNKKLWKNDHFQFCWKYWFLLGLEWHVEGLKFFSQLNCTVIEFSGFKKTRNLPMPMPTCPMGIFEYSFPWSMPSSLIQRRSWHWRKVFRGFSAHSVSPRLARTIANEVFVENFNCAIMLIRGLVTEEVKLFVMVLVILVFMWWWSWTRPLDTFRLGVLPFFCSDPCNWIFPSCDQQLIVTWVHPPY